MQLHELQIIYKKKSKKRVGRGGKRGTYSGKGMKGQKSRAGRKMKPMEMDLIQRLPKLRGFKNKSLREKPLIINIADLEKKFKNDIIDNKALLEAGIIKKLNRKVKILGEGKTKRIFQTKGILVSKIAKDKIETAGGKVL
ncbi:MAG: 50S ribosomal protein L15 [Patescibacteria group bacterium]